MSAKSPIEWTESTWNPVTGCNKISAGCKNCYAEQLSHRLKAMGQKNYVNGFKLTLQPHMLELPLKWKKPQMIFVNSMSDLFHKEVPTDYIEQVFDVMNKAHWHRFQVLTKRAERVAELSDVLNWSDNIWMGVSVENKNFVHRIDYLRYTQAKIKFLSLEPLLSPLKNLNLENIDWVIVGGESGFKARPMKEQWAIDIQKQCKEQGASFFFKQWGAWGVDGVKRNKKANGRILLNQEWNEKPKYETAFV
ncbi:MAG TPA: phage Gp37/Gp68 family protein [Pyrinomonadaceae bacterium]|jgi:protein gp37